MTVRDASASGVNSSIKITHRKTTLSPHGNSSTSPLSGGSRPRVSTEEMDLHPVGKLAHGADIIPLDELRNVVSLFHYVPSVGLVFHLLTEYLCKVYCILSFVQSPTW